MLYFNSYLLTPSPFNEVSHKISKLLIGKILIKIRECIIKVHVINNIDIMVSILNRLYGINDLFPIIYMNGMKMTITIHQTNYIYFHVNLFQYQYQQNPRTSNPPMLHLHQHQSVFVSF